MVAKGGSGPGVVLLQTAIEQGKFQDSAGKVREEALLAIAEDVAYGMRLLHTHDAVHGDLGATSILLTAHQARVHAHPSAAVMAKRQC